MKNILIRRVDNLGDMILVMPALKMLRNHFKKDKITLIVKPEHRVLLKEYADNFLNPVNDEDFKTLSLLYHFCFSIEYSLPGKDSFLLRGKSNIIHIGTKNWKKAVHISKHLTESLKSNGVNGRYQKPKFVPAKSVRDEADLWFGTKRINTKTGLVVSLDPNSGFEKKSWTLSGFVKVCRYLVNEFNATIIIPATSPENERACLIQKSLRKNKCYILAGYPIEMVAAVMERCDLHVGNDSGIGHLAAAVNKPTVSVFGPTDPLLWKPYGKKSIVIFKPEINCPGGYEHASICKIQKCLISIKPEEIIDGILYCLSKYVNYNKIFSFTRLKISDHLHIKRTTKGYVLCNRVTNHSCLIKKGWPNVKRLMYAVDQADSIFTLVNKQPHHKPLIDMLFMHRLLEPKIA